MLQCWFLINSTLESSFKTQIRIPFVSLWCQTLPSLSLASSIIETSVIMDFDFPHRAFKSTQSYSYTRLLFLSSCEQDSINTFGRSKASKLAQDADMGSESAGREGSLPKNQQSDRSGTRRPRNLNLSRSHTKAFCLHVCSMVSMKV